LLSDSGKNVGTIFPTMYEISRKSFAPAKIRKDRVLRQGKVQETLRGGLLCRLAIGSGGPVILR
jgi:hypothetical protein